MSDLLPQDTPITRARLADLPTADIEAFVESLQARRLRSQVVYEEAMKAKREHQADQDAALLEKRLDQFIKKAESVDNGLKALDKYAKEIIGLRLVLGHDL